MAVHDTALKTYTRNKDDQESVEKARNQLKPLEDFCAYLQMKACRARLKQLGECAWAGR